MTNRILFHKATLYIDSRQQGSSLRFGTKLFSSSLNIESQNF